MESPPMYVCHHIFNQFSMACIFNTVLLDLRRGVRAGLIGGFMVCTMFCNLTSLTYWLYMYVLTAARF